MAKTQTITFKKTGSTWADSDEAMDDMKAAINATPQSTDDFVNNTLPNIPCDSVSLDVGTQIYTEVRTWTDAEYTAYKDGITGIETDVTDALTADGWEITDTVV